MEDRPACLEHPMKARSRAGTRRVGHDASPLFPWFPTIDYEACMSDLDCLNFCAHEVFEWDRETGRPVVAHPDRCLPGCRFCVEICREGAIRFPSKEQFRRTLRTLREKARAVGPR